MKINRLKSAILAIKAAQPEESSRLSLQDKIYRIRLAFEQDWYENHTAEAERLVRILADGYPTPVLTVCGQGTREIRFTSYLAYFLNPHSGHGLGEKVLLAALGQDVPALKEAAMDSVTVEAETWIGQATVNSVARNCICETSVQDADDTAQFPAYQIVFNLFNHTHVSGVARPDPRANWNPFTGNCQPYNYCNRSGRLSLE